MSIYLESEVDLLNWVSVKAGATLLAKDVVFSKPFVNDNPANTKNTKIRMTMLQSSTTYKGSHVLYYDRLNLSGLANFPVPDYPPISSVGESVYTLLQKIRNSMGVVFTERDLVETFVEDDGEAGRILLKAKPDSVGWIGEYYLELAPKPPLAGLFKSDKINWS